MSSKKCPHCGKPVSLDENIWKPFCSERCKVIDLGNWASETYKIPGQQVSMDEVAKHNLMGEGDYEKTD